MVGQRIGLREVRALKTGEVIWDGNVIVIPLRREGAT